jgi:large repetitive protein
VIDWCKFAPNTYPNPNNPSSVLTYPSVPTLGVNMWTYTQTIKVNNTKKPKIKTSDNPNKIINVTGPNCGGDITITENADEVGACVPLSELKWTYLVDLYNDGIITNTPNANSNNNSIKGTSNGGSAVITGVYPIGIHKVTFTVEDQCGNQEIKEYTFTVRDDKKPTPYCLGSLVTVVMQPPFKFVELWAKDYDKGSTDNCPAPVGAQCGLYFTFNQVPPVRSIVENPNLTIAQKRHYFEKSGTSSIASTEAKYKLGLAQLWDQSTCSSSMYFDCDDALASPFSTDISVWDRSWNTDFCTVSLDIQGNNCETFGSRIAGNISRSQSEMIKDVQVTLENITSNETKLAITNEHGKFEFNNMAPGADFSVTPSKDDDYLNGVSTLDLVMIQRHVLGINKFDAPEKYIAGDVNNDDKITANDLVDLRKLILGIYAKLPNNKSWRFLDKSVVITDIANPWNVSESILINDFAASVLDENFNAIKVGDINKSATVNATGVIDNRTKNTLTFKAQDVSFVKGDEVIVNITSDNFAKIAGAQWTMNFDQQSVEVKSILPGAIKLDATNYLVSNGRVGFSWNDVKGQSFDAKEILFTIVFKATANQQLSQIMNITSDITSSEAYTQNLDVLNLNLAFTGRSKDVFTLGQNNPNPFTDKTTIAFTLPQAGVATINIYDLTGKVVRTITNTFVKGQNEIIVKAEDLSTSGVLFYELECQGFKSTKKMIYLGK